ncbi:MAG: TRAP transporter fused permease subunit [Chloroflexota bacterium]
MPDSTSQKTPQSGGEASRYHQLPKALQILFVVLTGASIAVAVYYRFNLGFLGTLFDRAYYYLLMSLIGSCVFLVIPSAKRHKGIKWYDLVAFGLMLALCFFFFLHDKEINEMIFAWVEVPSPRNFLFGLIMVLLLLEAARRTGGLPYLLVCLAFGSYPLFAGFLPGLLYGRQYSLPNLVGIYIFGSEGVMGLPASVFGTTLFGFLIFAGILISTGAGEFFIKLAFGLMGRYRGGPAKVAVLSSGFFGSLSGSVVANIVGTGSFTIPAMKRLGYPPHYAGAIEACASTGGILMPPVMGSVAFIMAQILNINYADVVIAAFIPAVLYYFGLLLQVDAYAANNGLKGLSRSEIPSIRQTLKEGWVFLFAIVFLTWGLLYMRWETITPYYASVLLILLSFVSRKTAMTPRRLLAALVSVGVLLAQLAGILFPIGLVIGGIQLPGTIGSITGAFVALGGSSVFLLLILGIIVCYVFGAVGMSVVPYVILAVTVAPGAIKAGGLNPLAVHLLIIYYSMLAGITPPIALGAFVGAAIAGAPPMKTAWTACRLGIVIYFVPAFFVFNPALVLAGSSWLESLLWTVLCMVGITLVAIGVEGYIYGIGRANVWQRGLLLIAGLLIAFPEWLTGLVGAVVGAIVIAAAYLMRRKSLSMS